MNRLFTEEEIIFYHRKRKLRGLKNTVLARMWTIWRAHTHMSVNCCGHLGEQFGIILLNLHRCILFDPVISFLGM